MFEQDVLHHASILSAAEGTVLALQTFGFGTLKAAFLMNVEYVSTQRALGFGDKCTDSALNVTGLQAASSLVTF